MGEFEFEFEFEFERENSWDLGERRDTVVVCVWDWDAVVPVVFSVS